jgi:hypothetical protein
MTTNFETKGVYIIIRATGEIEQVPAIREPRVSMEKASRKQRERFEASFQQMKDLVGGYLEHFPQHVLPGVGVYVNEEGQIHQLPINGVATVLLFSSEFPAVIVGDVVLYKPKPPHCDGLEGDLLERVIGDITSLSYPVKLDLCKNNDGRPLYFEHWVNAPTFKGSMGIA